MEEFCLTERGEGLIDRFGWMRQPVEPNASAQSPPLVGPIMYQRGCRNRHRDSTRTAQARAGHARPRYRSVTGRLSRAVFGDGRRSGHDQLVESVKAGNKSGWRADSMATARPGGRGRTEAMDHQDHQGPGSQPH